VDVTRRNHGDSIHAGELAGPAIARARDSSNVLRWEKAPDWMRLRWIADCWHAVWRELAAAYREQVRGAYNYRLTEHDVTLAERCALWSRYYVEHADWLRTPENRLAFEDREREGALAAEQHREPNENNLPPDARKRLATRPKRPDRLELPILPPQPGERPVDWPADELLVHWSVWLETLLVSRRTGGQPELLERQPGDDRTQEDD
jgi:hypothetical protein